MKISKIAKNSVVKKKVDFDSDNHELLVMYAELYKEIYSEEISFDSLVNEIIKSFLGSDKEFKKWLNQRKLEGANTRL